MKKITLFGLKMALFLGIISSISAMDQLIKPLNIAPKTEVVDNKKLLSVAARAAVERRQFDVRSLLENCGQISKEQEQLNNQLRQAVEQNQPEVVDTLIEARADIRAKGPYSSAGITPLHIAIGLKNIPMAQRLLAYGASINGVYGQGATPLRRAILEQEISLVKFCIDNGALINLSDNQGELPLHHAVLYGLPITELMLQHGADPNLPDSKNRKPLQRVAADNKAIKKLLMRYGATPLHEADQALKNELIQEHQQAINEANIFKPYLAAHIPYASLIPVITGYLATFEDVIVASNLCAVRQRVQWVQNRLHPVSSQPSNEIIRVQRGAWVPKNATVEEQQALVYQANEAVRESSDSAIINRAEKYFLDRGRRLEIHFLQQHLPGWTGSFSTNTASTSAKIEK